MHSSTSFFHSILPGKWRKRVLFDADWYLSRNPQIREEAAGDPLRHYMFRGGRQGLSPHPLFDGEWYLEQHPVVARLGINPLFHFYAWGAARGASPHPLFDSEWYLSRNPDVAAASVTPFLHYLLHGFAEGRATHPFFDGSLYFDANPDIKRAGFDPLEHFLRHGARERRKWPSEFSVAWYLKVCPEARDHADVPIVHYLKNKVMREFPPNVFSAINQNWSSEYANYVFGIKEIKDLIEFFRNDDYVFSNVDVRNAIFEGKFRDGLDHFCRFGHKELSSSGARRLNIVINGFNFDYSENEYINSNIDVKKSVYSGHYYSGFEHFILEGYREIKNEERIPYSRDFRVCLVADMAGVSQRSRKYLAIFAHFDADGIVDDYVYNYLEELRACGVDVVFVSACLEAADLERLKKISIRIIIKNEAGRDFGSWYLAIKVLGDNFIRGYENIIFANDSVYLPVSPLNFVFDKMERNRYNFWGIVDSREGGRYHIQSWFLVFDRISVEKIIKKFIEKYENSIFLSKFGQIREFEYGFSEIAIEENLSVGAFCSLDDIREIIIQDKNLSEWHEFLGNGIDHVNPSHDLWDVYIKSFGCPALKLELVRDNPRKVPIKRSWKDVVDPKVTDIDVIAAHMNRQKQSSTVTRLKKVQAPAINVHDLRILDRVKGCGLSGARRLVLLGHYDPQGIVDNHIMKMIASLRGAGCDVVTVTSSKSEEQIERVRRDSAIVLLKDDIGRDFGSWSLALESEREAIAKAESTIWMNDSIYFPLFDPAEMFDEMDRRNLDMWGIVDSHLVRWHVMSWFWSFNRRAQSNGLFDWYLKEYNPEHPKWAQIRNYEMRIPQMVKAAGHKVGAYIEAAEVLRHVRQNLPDHPRFKAEDSANVMHEFWDVVISKYRCPAIKVELVRDNPLGVDLAKLYETVARTDYDPNLIRDHIRRLRTGGVRH